jgi:membrane-bound serine protease (ClpP class)
VLQIPPGSSPLHQVQGLAKFLASNQIGNVTTVAWIPETLTGPHVLIALACREIVMPAEVSLGDIGRGVRLDPEEEQAALAVAQRRINLKVSPALVRGLLDPAAGVFRIRITAPDAAAETRVVTRTELEELRKTNAVIDDVVSIKEPGTVGKFSGESARGWDVLVTHLADNRSEVAELYALPKESLREQAAEHEFQRVRLIRVHGVVDPMLQSFLERQVRDAETAGVQLLIFEIDSSHGHLTPCIHLASAIAELDPQRMRTVAYIPGQATSGAALIAMACDEVYLAPQARWGSAIPANHREAIKFESSPDKLAQVEFALRTFAERKGRPAALAKAMTNRNAAVYETTHAENGRPWFHTAEELHASRGEWNQGPMLPDANGTQVLLADGRRATELKLAEGTVASLDELKGRLGIPPTAKIVRAEPSWVDQFVFLLNQPAMTAILLVLAISLLYLELHFTTTLLGLGSVLCFALFFWSKFLGGTAGWLEVVLFVFGLGCLAVEAFVLPGFGVAGVTGIIAVLASLIMASQTFGNIEPYADMNQLASSFGTVFAALVMIGLVGAGLSRILPRLPFFDTLVLAPPGGSLDTQEPRLRPDIDSTTIAATLVGTRGTALSVLRPAGKVQFGDRMLDVVSDGPFIPAGSEVEIVSASRTRIVVRQV